MDRKWIMAKLICPSIFNSVSFDYLRDAVVALDAADTDIFHLDVMDGSFVNNFALSPQDITTVRANTKKLIDVHLMINNPGRYVDLFADLGIDIIYVHPEAELHTTGPSTPSGSVAGSRDWPSARACPYRLSRN
jgi:ribulose-phosphate 3-epimerase